MHPCPLHYSQSPTAVALQQLDRLFLSAYREQVVIERQRNVMQTSISNTTIFEHKILSASKIPAIILVIGKDFHNFDAILAAYKKRIEKQCAVFDEIHLNGLETEPAALHAELCTLTMFASARLVAVRHAENLLKKIDQNKTVLAAFARDLQNLPDSIFLLLQFDEKKIPAGLKILDEKSYQFEEKELKEKDIVPFLQQKISQMGYAAESGSIELLVEKSGYDFRHSHIALDRLLTFTLHEKKITVKDVEESVYDTDSDLHYKIIDALATRDVSAAIKLLMHHRIEEATMITGAWAKLFSDALRYHYFKSAGLEKNEIHQKLGLNTTHSFIFQKNESRFTHLFQQFNLKEIIIALDTLTETDRQIKENTSDTHKTLLLMYLAGLR